MPRTWSADQHGCVLHQDSLQNLILEGCPWERISDLRFPDGQGEEGDLLQGLELHVLDQAAQLGDGDPLLVLSLASVSSVALPMTTTTPTATAMTLGAVSKASHSRAPGPLGPPIAPVSLAICRFLGEAASF